MKKAGWTINSMDDLNFMACQGSQFFSIMELLGMEKLKKLKKNHDKLIRIGVAHLTSMSTKQCDNRSFFVSSESLRGLHLILMTHYDVLSLLLTLTNLILYLKTLNSHLCYFLLNIVIFIYFSTYFFYNITLYINLPNVTLSNMSHLVYITLFGETDGVTLWRLECYSYYFRSTHFKKINLNYVHTPWGLKP